MIKLKDLAPIHTLDENVNGVKDVDVRGRNIPKNVIEGAYKLIDHISNDNIEKLIVADSYDKYTIYADFKPRLDAGALEKFKKNVSTFLPTASFDIVFTSNRTFKFTIPK